MQAYMEAGQPIYDEVFYQEMAQCFNKLHPKLLQSVGAQWDGMIEYANAGGDLGTIHIITSSLFLRFFDPLPLLSLYYQMLFFRMFHSDHKIDKW